MATRGIFQLRKLTLKYCEVGGSSRGIREYIGDGHLVKWATEHPHVNIEVVRRQNRHPVVHADYLTSPTETKHQISVKKKESWEDVDAILNQLANRSGRKIKKITMPVVTDTPSIQGVWTPFLNLQLESAFKVEILDAPEKLPTSESASISL